MIARLNLNRRYRRPMFDIVIGGRRMTALLDTGAEIPVISIGAAELDDLGGILVRRDFGFRGFGGKCGGELYRVSTSLGPLRFIDLPVVRVDDEGTPYAFIVSATMFSGFTYTIDDRAKILTVDTLDTGAEIRFRAGGAGKQA